MTVILKEKFEFRDGCTEGLTGTLNEQNRKI